MALTDNKSRVLSAATMSGYLVRNSAGEDIGCIEELMLEPEMGRVLYAVVSLGGLLGGGGKLFAVPYHLLRLDGERRVFVLGASTDLLENAPAFDEENWPDLGDPDWANRIHNHFGLRPHWLAA